MLFEQMRDRILKLDNREPGWKYGNWCRLFYDEAANLCYMGHEKFEYNRAKGSREFVGYSTLQDARVIFRPDNVAMINSKSIDADYFMLRSLTINGKINRGPDFRSRYRYVHDLQHEYEVIPYMEISMKTSKPTKARLLKNVKVDADRLIVVRSAIKNMRAATAALVRVDENKVKTIVHGQERWEILRRHDENAAKLAKLLQGFIDNKINGHWSNVVLKLMSAHYSGSSNEPIKKFDSMLRFHDAAVFRHLGVTR